MGILKVDKLHSESGANSNIELDDSRNVTVKGNLTVDGTSNVGGGGSSGTDYNDGVKVRLGTGNDLEIYHGTDNYSYIKNSHANGLWVASDLVAITNAAVSENIAKFTADGAVELYHNGSKKFETTSGGVSVTGTTTFSDSLLIGEDVRIKIGDSSPFQIFHADDDTNRFYCGGKATSFWTGASQNIEALTITSGEDPAVKLFYDGTLICYTSNGCLSFPDDKKIFIGGDNDLQIWHDGNNGYIKNITGNLNIRTGGSLWIDNVAGDETYIKATANGSVDIYYDNSKKFETTASGVTTTGIYTQTADSSNTWMMDLHHDGNDVGRYGVSIKCGSDSASGTNYALNIADGDGSTQGQVTFSGGTVTYGTFTAYHPCIVPNSDNPSDQSMAYPYGTLLETISIEYTQKNGANTERGIRYQVQKTQSANSKKVLGAYGGSLNGGPENNTNQHQALILGDGHILCNNAGGNISVGDGICSSSTAGIGQKATASPSMIIGIAQEDVTFTGTETKLVPVQYGLQQFTPWGS